MYIKRYYDDEIWKEITLKEPFCNRYHLYVSNYGQIKKFSKISQKESILKQGRTEGYPSVNISFLPSIPEADQRYFSAIRTNIEALKKEIRLLYKELKKCDGKDANFYAISKKIDTNEVLLDKIQTNYKANYRKNEVKRKLTFGGLVHRFVATHFVEKPSEDHKFVAHLDFDKTNNHHSNLRWMTQKENTAHQQNSPYVIKAKANALANPRITRQKLTIHQVMVIKKSINDNIPLRKLAKRYKVSETQLLRIKRGINWAHIPAAK